jgi:Undecaprenyl-phosphate galactose phosphotransferase WbaP
MVFGFLSLSLLAPLVRHFTKQGMMRAGLWGKPVIILGASEVGAQLVEALQRQWSLGLNPAAVLFDDRQADREAGATRGLESLPYGGTLTDAVDLAQTQRIDTIIFAMPHARSKRLAELIYRASVSFRHVIVISDLEGIANSAVVARELAGTLGMEIKHNLLNPWVLRIKRALDIGGIVAGAALILPLFLLISLLIRLESRGSVLYKDQRVGQNGKLFCCLKFRTMVSDADVMLQQLLEKDLKLQEEYSQFHKLRADPRITRVGRFLRRTSLDELPQFWNVLRGEMSLVGPRPYKAYESKDVGLLQNEILRVPPGVSGLWQVAGRNHTTFQERVQMDAYYVRNWSIWLDLVILTRTLRSVVSSRGAF